MAKVGKFEFAGFIAWLAWLVLHLYYLVGYRNRLATTLAWLSSFVCRNRGQMVITEQMVYARLAMDRTSEDHRHTGARSIAIGLVRYRAECWRARNSVGTRLWACRPR